jgi:acyl carrier protein
VHLQQLKAASEPQRQALVQDHIGAIVREIVGAGSAERFGPGQKLFELGLKSLDLIELKHRLEDSFSLEVPVTLFFAHSTVEKLTHHLLSELLRNGDGPPRAEGQPKPAATSEAPAVNVGRIDALPDLEAGEELFRRIAALERKLG